ncbi:MAG: tetratricopeptide repeat protein, partial [Acidobacteria bacterium]|nr:tetratricopeptide repeat protein [Acidobacteriota bacterium]
MLSFSKRSSHARSQALLMSIILSLTIISCTNKPKAVNSVTNVSKLTPVSKVATDPNQLQLNKPVERELVGGEIHSYTIKLEANQYLNAVVEQKGIDIVAALYNPTNEKVYEVDSPNGTAGPEPIYFISQVGGNYRLEVRSLDKQAKAGNYEVKINELRASIAEDIDRVAGYKALGETVLLAAEGKKQNEGLVINKYEEAIKKFDRANELLAKATAIFGLGDFYTDKGDYSKAEPLLIQALEIRKKALGENHPSTTSSMNNLASLYNDKGDYSKAEPLLIEALRIHKKALGENHPSTATSMSNLAFLYYRKGDYSKAEPLLIQALEIRKKALGENHPDTATSINNLALLYYRKGDYSKAAPLFIQALEIRKKTLGDNHLDTAQSINDLATFYLTKEDYAQAEFFYIQALKIYKKLLKENNPKIAQSIDGLAVLYSKKGDYNKAEPLLIQALEIRKKTLGDSHIDTVQSINNLAVLYSRKGDYIKAESLYSEVLEIRKKTLGDNHPDTSASINNLAALYFRKGDYNKAESLLIQALEIRKKTLGDSHLDTAQSINNLAALYSSKGSYDKAELLLLQVLDIQKKILKNDSPLIAATMSNLAELYKQKKDYNKAEELNLKALEIFKQTLGENHLDTVRSMSNLATIYQQKNEYSEVERLNLQVLRVRREILGEHHPDTVVSMNNLATFYHTKGDYNKAEELNLKALEIRRNMLGDSHPDIANSINNLTALYLRKEDYEKAVKHNKEANNVREGELSKNLLIGSETQKRLYIQKYSYETDVTLSLHLQNLPKNLEARKSALAEVLRRKGRSIDAVNQSVEALRKRSSPEDVELLDKLSEKTAYLSNLTVQGLGKRTPEEYKKLLESVREEVEDLQYKISERSAEFRAVSKPIMLEDVQKVVPKDATLVEFASYRPYDAKTRVYGAPRYVVYLLNNEGEPDWVDLGLAEPIDKLVDSLRAKLSDGKSSVNREIKPLARKLDKLVMQDVRRLVGRGKTLLIAPDGKLNLLPFAALVDERGKFLVENNKISYLTSGRDLLRLEIKIENKQTPVIIGDPDFGPIPDAASIKEGSTLYARLGFNRLASTELEAKAIKE